MLSQRQTDAAGVLAVALLMLLLNACSSLGSLGGTENRPATRGGPATTAAGERPGVEVPAAAQTLFEQAASVMANGDYLDAELRFKEFLLQYPEYPGAYVNLAIIHSANKNDAAARSAIESALALDPDYPAALNQSGRLLRRNGKFMEAEAAYLKAVTVSPEYALAHYNLGVLNELYLQRLDRALRHFETYLALVGEDQQVAKWVKDLTRRVAASQPSANVTE